MMMTSCSSPYSWQNEVYDDEQRHESQYDVTHEFPVVLPAAHHVTKSLHTTGQQALTRLKIATL